MRWVEQAESLLYECLEIAETTAGRVPRVHFEIDYVSRLYFRDIFHVNLSVERVGTTSLTYTFEIIGRNALAARGRFVVVLIRPGDQNPCAWRTSYIGECSWDRLEYPANPHRRLMSC
jgi:acyl-CoA thioester hydrolase